MALQVTEATFEAEVLKSDVPVLEISGQPGVVLVRACPVL